jgi:hypothetical protein
MNRNKSNRGEGGRKGIPGQGFAAAVTGYGNAGIRHRRHGLWRRRKPATLPPI